MRAFSNRFPSFYLFHIINGFFRNLSGYVSLFILSILLISCEMPPAQSTNLLPEPTITVEENPDQTSVIRLASGEWIPYTGKDLPGFGCDSAIITEVFKQMGYSVEYGFFPWARAMHFAETGEWDGTVDWGDTPEFRQKFYVNAEPISIQEIVFFYRKDQTLEWNSLDDLEGKVIGVTTGYVYDDVFKDQLARGNLIFVEASSDEANFKKLLAGRIDLFPIERNVGLALLKTRFGFEERNQIVYDTRLLTTFRPHLLLSKAVPRNAELITLFDRRFARLRQSNTYTELIKTCVQD